MGEGGDERCQLEWAVLGYMLIFSEKKCMNSPDLHMHAHQGHVAKIFCNAWQQQQPPHTTLLENNRGHQGGGLAVQITWS